MAGSQHAPPERPDAPGRPTGRVRSVVRAGAVLMRTVAIAAVVVCAWQSFWLGFSFEATDAARFAGEVGASLRTPAICGALVLALGVLVSRPRVWGARAATAVGLATSAAVMGIVVPPLVAAESRLHPSLAAERAALRMFVIAGVGRPFLSSEITEAPELSASWMVDGDVGAICPQAVRAFGRLVDPGTARPTPRAGDSYDRAGRRGADDVTLVCLAAPAPGSPVDVIVELRRVR